MNSTAYAKLIKDLQKAKPAIVSEVYVPKLKYLCVAGKSTPGSNDFIDAIGNIYGTAYTIKFMPRSGVDIPGYTPGYPVGAMLASYDKLEKGWDWQMMLPVPDFVDDKVIGLATEQLAKKNKPHGRVKLKEIEFGNCAQLMHVGPYDKEQDDIKLLNDYLAAKGKKMTEHIEIYISDPNRVTAEKRKTIIRYPYK